MLYDNKPHHLPTSTESAMSSTRPPLVIRMHAADNVAIVANDGGLAAGTVLPGPVGAGLVLHERVPQGHKVALTDLA